MTLIGRLTTGIVKAGAKYLKTSPTTSRMVHGTLVKTNHITGTQIAHLPEGAKTVVLGAGNRLSKIFGQGATITSYPKGHFFGGDTGCIALQGKGANGFLTFTPKEYGDFVKMMTGLNKIYV